MKHLFVIFFLIPLAIGSGATSVSDNGVTFTWSENLTVGYYAKGEPYVVAPAGLTMTSMTPDWAAGQHGAMLNPQTDETQGFDDSDLGVTYSAAKNIADDLPLWIAPNNTVVKAISDADTASNNTSQIDAYGFLTIVATAPPAGSFRPPWRATDKTSYFQISDLNFDALADLDASVLGGTAISQSTAENETDGNWYEHKTNWQGRNFLPINDLSDYGQKMAYDIQQACLWLNLDHTDAEKEQTLINIVQYGIDIHELIDSDGRRWIADGGHNLGRRAPAMLTAYVLNDAGMLANVEESDDRFQEERSTFYITQEDVDRAHVGLNDRPANPPYLVSDIGTAEWGFKHDDQPEYDGRWWDNLYRTVTGPIYVEGALLIHIMGMGDSMDSPSAFMDYADRYWDEYQADRSNNLNQIYLFSAAMWDNYREGSTPPSGGVATPTPDNTGGVYFSAVDVALSTSTAGAAIYYTLDGSDPDATDSLYSAPLTLSDTTTLKSIGIKGGESDSSISTNTYSFSALPVLDVFANARYGTPLSGAFDVTLYVTPSGGAVDLVVGLAAAQADEWSDLACIVLFNTSGQIQARDGGIYTAATVLNYSGNVTYAVQFVGSTVSHTYDVFVTPNGGATVQIADTFDFRTEQAAVSSLEYVAAVEPQQLGGTVAASIALSPPNTSDLSSRGVGGVRTSGGVIRGEVNQFGTGAIRLRVLRDDE